MSSGNVVGGLGVVVALGAGMAIELAATPGEMRDREMAKQDTPLADVILKVTREHRLFVGEKEVAPCELVSLLERTGASNVLVRVDKAVGLATVVDLMAAIKKHQSRDQER